MLNNPRPIVQKVTAHCISHPTHCTLAMYTHPPCNSTAAMSHSPHSLLSADVTLHLFRCGDVTAFPLHNSDVTPHTLHNGDAILECDVPPHVFHCGAVTTHHPYHCQPTSSTIVLPHPNHSNSLAVVVNPTLCHVRHGYVAYVHPSDQTLGRWCWKPKKPAGNLRCVAMEWGCFGA